MTYRRARQPHEDLPEFVQRREEIIQTFKVVGNINATAQIIGISRQRVSQVIKRHGDIEAVALLDSLHVIKDKACQECFRVFRTANSERDLCDYCLQRKIVHSKRPSKYLPYPLCSECGKQTQRHNTVEQTWENAYHTYNGNAYCGQCYALTPPRRKAYYGWHQRKLVRKLIASLPEDL